MLDEGNAQLSAVGFFNGMLGGGDAVSVGGGCGGMAGPFEMAGRDIVNNFLIFGRTTVSCADARNIVPEGQAAGCIVAEVAHGSSSADLSLRVVHANALPDNTLDKTYVPLYMARNGAWADVRRSPTVCGLE